MIRHILTGSRIELADAGCLYWARPDVALPERLESAAAALGSATHEAAQVSGEAANAPVDEDNLEDVLRSAAGCSWVGGEECVPIVAAKWGLTPSATEALGELYDTWLAWWREFVPEGAKVRYEVPYAWDTETWQARELPKGANGARDYSSARWSEVTCTVDAVIVEKCVACDRSSVGTDGFSLRCNLCNGSGRGRVTVVDLKTGRRRHAPAREHAQLATGALCVAGVLGCQDVTVTLAKILPGVVFPDSATLDAMALDGRALRLAEHVRALPQARPVPGPWCMSSYCPALAVCEGPRALARRVPELAAALPVAVETEEQAAAVLLAAPALQAYVDELKRRAVAWAERNGGEVRMPNGDVQRRVTQTRRTLDAERVWYALERHFGADGVRGLAKVRTSVSVTAVERAAAALGPAGRKRADVDARKAKVAEVLQDLETTGGVKVTSFATWEPAPAALVLGDTQRGER